MNASIFVDVVQQVIELGGLVLLGRTQPNVNTVCVVVYPMHVCHLLAAFAGIVLPDAQAIDPVPAGHAIAVEIETRQTLQSVHQIRRDTMRIDDCRAAHIVLPRGDAPGVGQGAVRWRREQREDGFLDSDVAFRVDKAAPDKTNAS